MGSEAATALLFDFLYAVTLVGVDVAEQRRAAIEQEVGDRDDVDGLSVRAAEVETTGNAALVA